MAADEKYPADMATVPEYVPKHEDDRRGSVTEPKVGELEPGEAEAGGLGRHLGLFSTTFLMYIFSMQLPGYVHSSNGSPTNKPSTVLAASSEPESFQLHLRSSKA